MPVGFCSVSAGDSQAGGQHYPRPGRWITGKAFDFIRIIGIPLVTSSAESQRMRIGITAVIALAAFVVSGCTSASHHKSNDVSDETLVTHWRDKQVTISQIEAATESPERSAEWDRFKGKIKPGDEVWHFCSPGPTWENRMGWEGYAIFRGSRLVETLTTREN